MANTEPLVHLKLQHGTSYTDLPSGKRWTADNPIQAVPKARAAELLRETLPLYQGETSRTVRRFAAVPAPPPAAPKPAPLPLDDEGAERTAEEIEAEIEAAQEASSRAPTPAPTGEGGTYRERRDVGEGGGRPPRQRERLPRTPDADSSGGVGNGS